MTFEGNFDRLNKQVAAQVAPLTSRFGKLGKTAVVGLGGMVAAAGAAGGALYKIGENFDDAYDTIRVGTGKTGRQLKGLQTDFRNVVKSVPTDFGSASKAITQINQRLGVTGKPLRGLSKQFLELSRITETDLGTNIEAVTRVFGDWGIEVSKQPAYLDRLFRASQKTGVPVAQLAQTVTKFGGPLRQLGFSFDQAAAMAGKFEKEGVNTELVMGSMRIALGKMAREGEAPASTLRRVTDEIKNAGSAGEANKKALELFGARAGPDMAAAIREGRFELGNLERQIRSGKDTIVGAGKDTQDFGEKWQILKNKVMVGLEPLATRVFGAVGNAMDRLAKVDFSKAINSVRDFLRPLSTELGKIANDPNLSIGQKIAKSISASGSFIADAAARALAAAAPHAGRAFVTAFQNSSPLGRLFIIGMLASKLGVFSSLGQLAATKFTGAFGKNLKFAGVIGGALALAGVLASVTSRTKSASVASRDLVAALDAERNAMKRVRDLDLDAAQARNTVKQSAIALEQAEKELDRTRKSANGRTLAVRQAETNLSQARIQHKRDVRALRDIEGDATVVRREATDATLETVKAQYDADRATLGWAEANKRLKARIDALPARKDIQITADTSEARRQIELLIGAINTGIGRALTLVAKAREAATVRGVSNAEGPVFGLENTLLKLEEERARIQARIEMEDRVRERTRLERAAHLGQKLTEISKKNRNEVRQARTELAAFNLDLKRTREVARVDVKIGRIEGLVALREALKGVRSDLTDKMSQALSTFEDQWEKSIGRSVDKANAASLDLFDKTTQDLISTGPAATALRDLQAESERIAREQEDAANAREMADALESRDAARIAEAQARIDETNRQRQITLAQSAADAERAAIEEQRRVEREALEEQQLILRQERYAKDTAFFKGELDKKLKEELAQLEERKQNYAQFAKDVNAILQAYGLSLDLSAEAEKAIDKAPQKKKPKAKPTPRANARAVATASTVATNVVPAHVQVWVGDREITDIVDFRINDNNRKGAQAARAGVA